MIDMSKLKAPGWKRVVAELSATAPDDNTFLVRLVSVLGQVAGARQVVLFAIDSAAGDEQTEHGEARSLFVWPTQPGGGQTVQSEVEYAPDARSAAAACASANETRVFGLEKEDKLYDGAKAGFIIALPIPSAISESGAGLQPRTAVTLLVDHRSEQALQTTMALVETLAGYIHAHAARQQLKRTRAASASLDLASRLIASVNSAPNFKGSALQLVNDLMRQMKVDRAALGLVRKVGRTGSGSVRIVSISDTEHIDRRMSMVQKLEAAMDECLDQEQPILHPAPPESGEEGDVLLAQAITHAHRELASSDAKLKIASLPLRVEEEVIGVITIETGGDGQVDLGTIELLQATLDLIAPVLEIRRSDDRALPTRAWDSCLKTASWAVGPKHTVWKMVGLIVMIAAVCVFLVHVPYRVEAPATLQPRTKQAVSVPFAGVIAAVPDGIEAGVEVAVGDVLVEMDDSELRLRLDGSSSDLLQAQKESDALLKAGKLSEADQANARAAQAQASIDQFQYYIDRAAITAPIAGTIIQGNLKDKVGAAVEVGEMLYEIAPLDDIVILADVDDRDIKLIQDRLEEDGSVGGYIATKAYPGRKFEIEIERIVPLARAEEGVNAFEVRAKLVDRSVGWMRPGMEGLVKFDTGRKTIAHIATRRIKDVLNLWLWW